MLMIMAGHGAVTDLRVKKSLVTHMENEGLIEDTQRPARRRSTATPLRDPVTRELIVGLGPEPLVYLYTVTDKGRELLNSRSG
jgi:predicted transcriptional regulator